MNREHIYYALIGGGLLVIVGIVVWQVWPEEEEPLVEPIVLTEQLNSSAPVATKVQAAHEFVRHGPAARVEVRTALQQHAAHEPEVVAPLIQATMKNRDYRSMPTLLDLLEHEDPLVRGRAGAAVQKILGADFGFRANAPERERQRVIAIIKSDYEQSKGRFSKVYGSQ